MWLRGNLSGVSARRQKEVCHEPFSSLPPEALHQVFTGLQMAALLPAPKAETHNSCDAVALIGGQ
jgi:hypothetical protein